MVDRLFQIVYLLMERPVITAEELANLFEVSRRTIYRDVDKLSLAGVPIYSTQGKHGGLSLLPEYVLNKAILTEEEKIRLTASLNALSELGYQDEKNNISKLNDFFGDKFQDWLEVDFNWLYLFAIIISLLAFWIIGYIYKNIFNTLESIAYLKFILSLFLSIFIILTI